MSPLVIEDFVGRYPNVKTAQQYETQLANLFAFARGFRILRRLRRLEDLRDRAPLASAQSGR